MSKRTPGFTRAPRDYYGTIDPDAIKPLLPFIRGQRYCEPCAGRGDLIDLLRPHATCINAYDIEPADPLRVMRGDAVTMGAASGVDCYITNPPFSWVILEPLVLNLTRHRVPVWLLLPADMMHNKRMVSLMTKCSDVVSIGRLFWQPNRIKGVDNYAWFCFTDQASRTVFYHR